MKLIIDNRSRLEDSECLTLIQRVMEEGRVSNNGKQYCYVTRFHGGVTVYSDLNKKSDRFIIVDSEQNK